VEVELFTVLMDTGKLPETREELYEGDLEEIKKVQPEGPYFLAGHCYGTIIAYELARILEERKNLVEKVILLDEPAIMSDEVMEHILLFRMYNKCRKIVNALKNSIKWFKMKLKKEANVNMCDNKDEKSNPLPEDLEARRGEIQRNYRRLFHNFAHFTRIINAPVLVIKTDIPAWSESTRWAPETIAKQSRQGAVIVNSPGTHSNMFSHPYVVPLAKNILENV
jgi:thioesterase domain-containing protein